MVSARGSVEKYMYSQRYKVGEEGAPEEAWYSYIV